jgi:PII-like signaling protein
MKLPAEAELLRIFIGESDKHRGRPLYEVIVEEARRKGLAGATVLRGTLGFGANSRIHTARILRLSEDLPMVVEIVDKPDRIADFLPHLDGMIGEGLVTLERVRVIMYRHDISQGVMPANPPESS